VAESRIESYDGKEAGSGMRMMIETGIIPGTMGTCLPRAWHFDGICMVML